jgi:CAAX protease family protein
MAPAAIPLGPHPISERPRPTGWKALFFGPAGLRAGWSFLLFSAIYLAVAGGATYLARTLWTVPRGWSTGAFAAAEALSLAGALVALVVLARIERRSFATYGFPLRAPGMGRRFAEGALWGAASVAAVVLSIAAAGGYSVAGFALHGEALVKSALLWALAFLLVGVSEEIIFRSFPLYTLARGLGFWPGAILFSAFFGALHYFGKPMETWMDFLSVSLIGLFFCLTVRRTGDVWFAAGYHFAFNFTSMGVCGSPNTINQGQPMPGHLLAGTFHGPTWRTGGPMGAEASAFVFPVLAALFVLFLARFRTAKFPADLT